MRRTADLAILSQLAAQHRRLLSEWRAIILLRRASFELPESERRWESLPQSPREIRPLLKRMELRGEIQPLEDHPGFFRVTTPYAGSGPIDDEEILMEAHPYSTLSHLSAMFFHNLTDQFPNRLFATVANGDASDVIPVGTSPDDWEGITPARGRKIPTVHGRSVHWTSIVPRWFFGFHEYQRPGYPVRITTPERTLLDGLREPDLCGGLDKVLQAWASTKEWIDLSILISYLDQFNIGVLYQRVGFILDELGLIDPRIDDWTQYATRGGSSKLLASAPYAPTYSERWNLSINGSIAALRDSYV